MKKIIITSIGFLLLITNAFALDPFGPPVARLNKTQPIIGLEYLYSEMDLHADSLTVETPLGNLQFPSTEIEAIQTNKFYVNLVSVIGDDYDIFLRLGIMNASPDKSKNRENFAGSIGDSDYGFPTFGGGFRTTLYQSEDSKTKFGLLAQFSYANLDFDEKTYSINGSDISLSSTVDMFEIQLAAGPSFQVTDELSIYGGPFLHFVKGDAELRGNVIVDSEKIPVHGSSDFEQESELGGFIGLSIDLAKNTNFNIEFQLTDDARAVGFRLNYQF